AVGVSALPGRPGVRAVALVHEREPALDRRIGEVGVELLDLIREQQALVDQRAAGEARHVEAAHVEVVERLLDPLADHVELALEGGGVEAAAAQDETLSDARHGVPRLVADVLGMYRHVAPAQEVLAFFGDDALDRRLTTRAVTRVLRQERRSDAVLTRLR